MTATGVIAMITGDPGMKAALVCTNGAKSDSRVIAQGGCNPANSATHAIQRSDSRKSLIPIAIPCPLDTDAFILRYFPH